MLCLSGGQIKMQGEGIDKTGALRLTPPLSLPLVSCVPSIRRTMTFTLLHQRQQLPGKEVRLMTRVLPVPHTDVAVWDDAPQPSPNLVRVLDDVERALVPPPDPP